VLQDFEKHIDENLSFLKKNKLLIAISGGMDSVVLTHLCHRLKLNVALAHCNFNLRGEESDADEKFVTQLAAELNLEVFVQNFNTISYAETQKLSIQMAARELRYQWFEDLSQQKGFEFVLTAHHADDNLETILMNITRGTGLDGLIGIPTINRNIVRPLLPFSRAQISKFLKDNHLQWREDASNASTKYIRNKIRHEVVPVLKEINPNVLNSIELLVDNLKDSRQIVADRMQRIKKKILDDSNPFEIRLDVSKLEKLKTPKPYLYQLLKDYGFSQWEDILNLLNAKPGKYVCSPTHRLLKNRDELILTKNPSIEDETIIIPDQFSEIVIPMGVLKFEEVDEIEKTNSKTIFVDAKKLKFPLILRKRKEGDLFYPFGMKGKKKLGKFFKDEKFSLVEKENTWLLCSGEYIVWVVGYRADNRFKVSDKTKKILKVTVG